LSPERRASCGCTRTLPDGVIHIESPVKRTYTLGELFDIWGQSLDHDRLGAANGPVTAFFNGRVFTGTRARFHCSRMLRSSSKSDVHWSHPSRSRFPVVFSAQ
jgi:hypothetical protein